MENLHRGFNPQPLHAAGIAVERVRGKIKADSLSFEFQLFQLRPIRLIGQFDGGM